MTNLPPRQMLAADLSASDFELESCVWVGPDCWDTAEWSASCARCGEKMGGVCGFHHEVLITREVDDTFCKFCGLTGIERDLLTFEMKSR